MTQKIVAAGFAFVAAKQTFAVVRYGDDGSRDTSFGTGGLATTSFGDSDTALALAAQADGKYVVAGRTSIGPNAPIALARYNTDGALDGTFGTGGKVTTQLPGSTSDEALAVAVQGDGKIVVAGDSNGGTANLFLFVARYSALGVLDATFGTGGVVVTDFGAANPDDGAFALLLQGDGKIVAVGTTNNGAGGFQAFALARYLTGGALDAAPGAFGTGGKVITNVGAGDSIAYAAALQDDGKVVAAGQAVGGGGYPVFALARYGTDGTLDAGFGTAGKVLIDFSGGGGSDIAQAVAVQGDGKVVVAGSSLDTDGFTNYAVARCNADGTLDAGFGAGGKVLLPAHLPATFDQFQAVAIQADGKVVAAGGRDGPAGALTSGNAGVARYSAAGAPDAGFGTAGLVDDTLAGAGGAAYAAVLEGSGPVPPAPGIDRLPMIGCT